MFPAMKMTLPYSPTARAKASPKPVSSAGVRAGRTTRRSVCARVAPRVAAASSASSGRSRSTGSTVRTMKGRPTKASATTTPTRVKATRPQRRVAQPRLDGAHDEGQADEGERDHPPDRGEGHPPAEGRGEGRAEPAVRRVERGQRHTRDRGRQGEGQVDHGIGQAPPGEVVAREHPGDE